MGTFSFATESTHRLRNITPKPFKKFIPLNKPFSFAPLIPIDFSVGKYQIKTASTFWERKQCYLLRFDVFHREMVGNRKVFGIDRDRFDDHADLLIIKDTTSGKVVGTYRLIWSQISKKFYSATEFSIDRFVQTDAIKVELSRACVHKDYRKGIVIALLWQGLSEYLKKANARYLFGLSSVNNVGPKEIFALMQYFQSRDAIDNQFGILPTVKYCQSKHILHAFHEQKLPEPEVKDLVPALLRAYLNAGAKVATVPAYDEAFLCYDFMTIMDTAQLNANVSRKFGVTRH